MTLRHVTTIDARAQAAIDAAADVTLQMDEESFRGFYSRTARMLWAYLERLTGDGQLADDLLQESYYRLLRSDVTLDGEIHSRRYLFRIATNLAHDAYRRRRARPALVSSDDGEHPRADRDLSAHGYDGRLDLNRALGRLRPRERALLWLAYAQGATHREIAEVLGVRPASVKVLLLRARRRLASLLGRRGATP